ncbi:lipoprotein [Listeria fleischmannii 1991]|uniref:DUF3221 domain-containing protein n=3 Tax=Listeria fleischmannii TaxID=1069827 RepID=A0A2X3GG87_9LIST|nr:hypothetical protein [Listeria fleischmannii]EMG28498.1 lipoprotein [Listeria fleischmannii subsp. fleischmannii LU2006-1]KMT59261.1 lipoprotein [Listeria fleischmannii 1991]SQC67138.1 Uncharacterised protein [Listeria fleischmannii subsp. fleischmannii]
MKKPLLLLIIICFVFLVACMNEREEENVMTKETVTAFGVTGNLRGGGLLVTDFRVKGNAKTGEQVELLTSEKYYNKKDEKIAPEDIEVGSKVEIKLWADYSIKETSPGQIEANDIEKITVLN